VELQQERDHLYAEVELLTREAVRLTQRAVDAEENLDLLQHEIRVLFNQRETIHNATIGAVNTLRLVAGYIESLRCHCNYYSAVLNRRPCLRCEVLGRRRNERIQRVD
jgi:hypothetical protein